MHQAGRFQTQGDRAQSGQTRSPARLASPPVPPSTAEPNDQQVAQARRQFVGFAGPLISLAGLLGAILFFALGPKPAVAVSGAIVAFSLSFRYPRQALWFFFLYMPFSGTITYALAGGNALFQLAKDAFYFPALLALLLAAGKAKQDFWRPAKLLPWMGVLLGVCILSLLFVNLPRQFLPGCTEATRLLGRTCAEGQPFPQGLLGLKVFLGYVPLIFCMQILIKSRKEFLFFARAHVVLALVCAALSLLQYLMLKTGRCVGTDHLEGELLFKASLGARCFVGGSLLYSPSQNMIRLPGTFVAPWQWGWFLISNAYFTCAAAFGDPKPLWRLGGLASLGLVFASAVISGQRIALALVPLSVIALLLLTGQVKNLRRFIPMLLGLIGLGAVGATVYAELIQDRILSFVARWQASPADEMIAHQFNFIWPLVSGKPLGNGLGSATNSARMFGPTLLVETWFPKILYEVGLVGLLAFLLFVTALSWFTFRAYRSIQDRNLRSYAACFWLFVLFISYQTYYYPLDVDPVAVYFWALIGVLLRLPAIDQAERLASASRSDARPDALPNGPPGTPPEMGQRPRFAPVRSGD